MSISAISTGSAGLRQAVGHLDRAAAHVASATTPIAADTTTGGPPPPAATAQQAPQSSLVEAQVAVLASHTAVQANLATIRTAQAMYADSIALLSSGSR